MVLDVEFLNQALRENAMQAVRNGLLLVQARAKEKAPLRNIFRKPKASSRKMSAADVSSGRNFVGMSGSSFTATSAGRANSPVFTGGQRARQGLRVFEDLSTEGQVRTVGSVPGKQRGHKGKVGGSITGRTNSYAPVITPSKLNDRGRVVKTGRRVGGEQLRHWSGNALTVQTIKTGGKTLNLADSLSVRGRYEVATGRAKTTTAGGQMIIGGTLREGITIEGPFDAGDSIFGYVSAYAKDPSSVKRKRPDHNYAADQEFGSRHNAPHPFLRPALWESASEIQSGQSAAIKKAFRGARKHTSDDDVGILLVLDVRLTGWAQFARQWRSNFFPKEA